MSVDKFGRNSKTLLKSKGATGPAGLGFKLLPSGDYNMENKRLSNVGRPEQPHQAASKEYVDEQISLSIQNNDSKNYMDSIVKKYLDGHIKNKIVELIEERKMFSPFFEKIENTIVNDKNIQ